jgi:hypothetical protein
VCWPTQSTFSKLDFPALDEMAGLVAQRFNQLVGGNQFVLVRHKTVQKANNMHAELSSGTLPRMIDALTNKR